MKTETNEKEKDIKEIKLFTKEFEKEFKDKVDISSYKINKFRDYLKYGAVSIYTVPKPKNFKQTKWAKNPQIGMIWISTGINPNGVTSEDDICRTYAIKFEQIFQKRNKYARNFHTDTIHQFYAYGRTIEEVISKFDSYLSSRDNKI